YILALDADDKMSANYIEVCMETLHSGHDVKVAYGELSEFGATNAVSFLPKFDFRHLLHKNSIFCTALYRKKDWEAIGGYDENMKEGLEDWEFWINMFKTGGLAVQNPAAVFYYRIKEESRNKSVSKDALRQKRLKEYVFNKHLP